MTRENACVAEWWPSSARLAVNRDYGRYIHAPQWTDVVAVLQEQLAASLPAQPSAPPKAYHHTGLLL